MKNKIILILSGLIVANTVLGDVGGEEDVFETKDVFGSNEAQLVHQETTTTNKEIKKEPTIANEELKVQVIPYGDAFQERNGFVIQKGMDQYIIEYHVWDKKELDRTLEKLRPLYTDKAKKLGKKPIVFKQLIVYNLCDISTEESDEFSIESFFVFQYCDDTDEFGKFYNALIKYNKPIVFEYVKATYKDEIEKNYDLSNCKINGYFDFVFSFEEYLKLKELGIENLKILYATIKFKPFSEQNLKKKLKLFLKYIDAGSREEIKKGAELLSRLLNKYVVESETTNSFLFEFFEEILEEDCDLYKHGDWDSYLHNAIRDLIQHIEEAEKFPITDEKELRKQLYAYTRDNHIENISIENLCLSNNYEKGTVSIPIEYASCLELDYKQLINPKNTEAILFVPKEIVMMENVTCDTLCCGELKGDIGKNVSCKTIICLDYGLSLNSLIDYLVETKNKIKNLETVYIGVDSKNFDKFQKGIDVDEDDKKLIKRLKEENISLHFYDREKLDKGDDYEDHIETKNIMHLSGYVNVKNKPDELSDEEWDQVLVLKQKVKEIINAVQTDGIYK
ncbi:MAG: hypothetical protein ACLRFH_00090 [Opitutales bacterium]